MSECFGLVELDPTTTRFERSGDTLSLWLADGRHYPRVVLRRCFPVSDDVRFVSVRDAGSDGHEEIGILSDCRQLPPADRAAVLDELSSLYFVPRIERVVEVREEYGFYHWSVETNRGQAEFVMRDGVITFTRELAPGHWLLIDVNQSRWEIKQLSALDAKSQKLVRRALYL